MKQLVITDKGIGIAEMPEKPIETWPSQEQVQQYEAAVKQAIASAPLFEDQERVKEELFYMKTGGPQVDVPVGSTYPIPPDFPEYVEVIQKRTVDSINWYDVLDEFTTETNVEYRTILRFVDKQEQRKEEGNPHAYRCFSNIVSAHEEESQEELWQDLAGKYAFEYDPQTGRYLDIEGAKKEYTIKRK